MDGIANNFPANVHWIAVFCIYNLIIFFPGVKTPEHRRSAPVLGHRQAFPLLLFYETTTGWSGRTCRPRAVLPQVAHEGIDANQVFLGWGGSVTFGA